MGHEFMAGDLAHDLHHPAIEHMLSRVITDQSHVNGDEMEHIPAHGRVLRVFHDSVVMVSEIYTPCRRLSLSRFEGLGEVVDNVVHVLDAHGQAN